MTMITVRNSEDCLDGAFLQLRHHSRDIVRRSLVGGDRRAIQGMLKELRCANSSRNAGFAHAPSWRQAHATTGLSLLLQENCSPLLEKTW
jgi:hypothetical protein